MAIAWAKVTLPAPEPGQARGEHRQGPLQVWAVRVWEPEPPQGVEAVEWLLLTDLPVSTAEEALRVGAYYCVRWQIEVFFGVLKGGCRAEERLP